MTAAEAPTQRRKKTLEEWTVWAVNQDSVTMVLLAWAHGCPSAKMAIVDRADSCGLEMRAVDGLGRHVRFRVQYKTACHSKETIKAEILELREKTSRPRILWSSPMIWLVLAMWTLLIAAWLHKHDVHVLEKRLARLIGLHKDDIPPSRELLGYVTLAIVGTNLLEASAVAWYLKTKFRFSAASSARWFFTTLLLGYPVAQRVVDLKAARSFGLRSSVKSDTRKDE